MAPSFSARPWGGTRLRDVLRKTVPEGGPYGEAWEVSDHPDGPSRIAGGDYDGMLLGDLLRRYPRQMIGRINPPERFPLLVKYIDAAEDLSVQVHPDDAYAAQHTKGDRGKTECWFIMDCGPTTEMILGLAPGTTRASLERAINEGQVEQIVQRHPIRPGMFIFIPAGTVHAVLADTLLCEVQQSSNTTYRFYDWNRKPERQLHIAQSLDVIDYTGKAGAFTKDVPFEAVNGALAVPLVANPFFATGAVVLAPGRKYRTDSKGCLIANIVRGEGTCAGIETRFGETWFLPAACGGAELVAGRDGMTVLLSTSREL